MSERLIQLINDTQIQLNLTDVQLAEKLFVPVKALEEWKRGLISPVYEPLLAMSLAFIRLLAKNDSEMKEVNEQIEQLRKQRQEAEAEYYRKMHITGTCQLIDGKTVVKYFDEQK